jgi:hypothetical protein
MSDLGLTGRYSGYPAVQVAPIGGREPLLDHLIPELTGLRLDSSKRPHHQFPRGADIPVILLAGPRGMGKSAVLDVVTRGYVRRLPLARIDLADPELAVPSPVTAVLFRFTQRLAGRVHGQGRLHCLRLNLGLAAVTAKSLPTPRDKSAWDRAVRLLRLAWAADAEDPAASAPPLPEWVNGLPDILTGSPQDRRAAMIKAAFGIIAVYLGKLRLSQFSPTGRAGLRWYADRFPEANDGLDALVTLGECFKAGGQQRRQAEDTLLEAFLADIRAAFFAGPRARNRVVRPVVLLDHADTELGERLLKTLLVRRHRAAYERATPDPLVIIGAVQDITRFAEADICGLDDLRQHSWRRGSEPASGALIIDLGPLELDDVGALFRRIRPDGIDPDLPYVVYRITQGNPLGASELARAVRREARRGERDPGRPVTATELLTLAADGDVGDVLTSLLRQLIPDAQARGGLVALSLAEDAEEAALIAKAATADATGLISACEHVLRDEGWADGDGFVGSPFLRTLLLAECHRSGTRLLRDSSLDPTAELGWDVIARGLRDHYRPDPAPDAIAARRRVRWIYHELTLSGAPAQTAGAAAVRLLRGFTVSTASEWLATVGTLGQAPYFGPLGHLRNAALCRAEPGQDQMYLVVRRLLLATWYLFDPRTGPDEELIGVLCHDLRALERLRPGDGTVFRQASATWPHAFRDGQWRVPRTWTGGGLAG